MNKTHLIYKYILKCNNFKISKENYLNFHNKINLFFSNYLKKNLLKDLDKNYLKLITIKSYFDLTNTISKSYHYCPSKNIFVVRIFTIFLLIKDLFKSFRRSLKSKLKIEHNLISRQNIQVCFRFPPRAFNRSKSNKSSFYNSLSNKNPEIKILSINESSRQNENYINDNVTSKKTKFSLINFLKY